MVEASDFTQRLIRIEWLAKRIVEEAKAVEQYGPFMVSYWCIAQMKELLDYEGRFDECDPPCMMDAPGNNSNNCHGQPWGG